MARNRKLVLVVGVCLISLSVVACGSNSYVDPMPTESVSESEEATPAKLAETWPAEVPGPADAVLLSSAEDKARGTVSAVWMTELTPADAFAAYTGVLEAAGFEQTSETPDNGAYTGVHSADGFNIEIAAYETAGATVVTAVVRPQG